MNRETHPKLRVAFILLLALSLACSSQVTVFETPAPPNVETLVAGTLVALTGNAPTATIVPTSTFIFVPTLASTPPSPTPGEYGEVYLYTAVDNVNLRTNPGLLFTVSRVMPKNTRLLLVGQAPGGEWLYVMNEEGIAGWVNRNVVQAFYDGLQPPTIEPKDAILVKGTVLTELGTPVSGIGFSVSQGSRHTRAMTDADGQFHAYLPTTMSGMWTVEYDSVACTSNTMDVNCNCINNYCGTAHPASAIVQLPQTEPLIFIWK
jgi:hypothetical protein